MDIKDERIRIFAKLCNPPVDEWIEFAPFALSKEAVEWRYLAFTNPEIKRLVWHLISEDKIKEVGNGH